MRRAGRLHPAFCEHLRRSYCQRSRLYYRRALRRRHWGSKLFDYVAGWAGDMEKVIAWGEAVQKMARELIDRVQKKYPPGKAV